MVMDHIYVGYFIGNFCMHHYGVAYSLLYLQPTCMYECIYLVIMYMIWLHR